jgi:hypothetical protein
LAGHFDPKIRHSAGAPALATAACARPAHHEQAFGAGEAGVSFWTVSDLSVTSFDFANFEDRLESLERLGRCEKWKIDTLLKVGFVKYFESTGARRSSSWKFLGAVGHRNLGVILH